LRIFILKFLIPAIVLLMAAGCATVPDEYPRTIAVWDLENLSLDSGGRPDLGEMLSAEINQTVGQTGNVLVVERQKLLMILEELRLGSSSLAEESTRLKVGRMLGAREMIFGDYMVIGPTMRIDLRRVDVETGRVLKTAKQTADAGDLNGWLKAARDAASGIYP